jgi:glycosyltransferase involved in cell wall biosynthesis
MTTGLAVEGWRRSSHSYALVNQHQLVHLLGDPRFDISHLDIPFVRPEWANVDAGLHSEVRRAIDGLPPPAPGASPDVIYRISWPLRVYGAGRARVFVFGTSESQWLEPDECCGPSGTFADVDRDAVEIITPSNWSRAGFVASGFDERRVHVIPHGVDPTLFWHPTSDEKRQIRADLQIAADALVFLSIGAMTWNKGIGPLLAAFAIHHQRNPQAVLLLKGGEQLYGNLLVNGIKEAGRLVPGGIAPAVQRAIRYSGLNLTLAELAKLYRASDVYVSPYRAEGFNLPVLEALASGLLPVVTAGGSTDDFCPDVLSVKVASTPARLNERGRYLDPSLESLVECLNHAATDETLRRRVAAEGPRWVVERLTWAHVTKVLADRLAGAGE